MIKISVDTKKLESGIAAVLDRVKEEARRKIELQQQVTPSPDYFRRLARRIKIKQADGTTRTLLSVPKKPQTQPSSGSLREDIRRLKRR